MRIRLIFPLIIITGLLNCKAQSGSQDKKEMKELKELINTDEPGWELLEEWFAKATNHFDTLPRNKERAEKELYNAQVTTRSPMGAIIYQSGGILVDHGWIRILGSGHPRLDRGIMEWNKGKTYTETGQQPSYIIVADDVVGGYFALNGGGLKGKVGDMFYYAPDSLEWENMEMGYSQFIYWTLTGNLEKFYETLRWKTWKEDTAQLDGNRVFSFFPFLFTKQEGIDSLSREAVPVDELFDLHIGLKNKK